jgi:hypothetical protein
MRIGNVILGSSRLEILNVSTGKKKSVGTNYEIAKFATPFWRETGGKMVVSVN